MSPDWLWVAMMGLVGLCIGSFLNVVIHRLPIMMERAWEKDWADSHDLPAPEHPVFNLATPRSRCPHCGHGITALENIPLVSYLMLKGKCSDCKAAISPRYPLVELLTGLLSALLAFHFGPSSALIGALLLTWTLIALSGIDIDTQYLPDSLTLPLLWLGLAFNLEGVFVNLHSAVLGAMGGYLILWLVFWGFKLCTGKEGMGYGDFKLLAALGAWLGWAMLPLIILFASVVGAAVGLTLIALSRLGFNIPIPFGPYLAMGGVIALIWGKPLLLAYLA